MARQKRDIYRQVTDGIVAVLEAGVVPWRRPWDAGGMGLPLRVTGEAYRGMNVVLLWHAALARGYVTPIWLTWRQATELGGQVRKGARSVPVIRFGTSARREQAGGEAVAVADESEATRRFGWVRRYAVFNVAEVDGLAARFHAPATPPRRFDTGADPALMAWFGRTGLRLETGAVPQAWYSPSRDVIHMPPVERFETAAGFAATLLHESAHATGSVQRLDRLRARNRFGDQGYAREEIVADVAAAMVAARLGIAPDFEQTAAYLDSWIAVLRSDARAIVQAASAAQAAADWLIERGGALEPAAAVPVI